MPGWPRFAERSAANLGNPETFTDPCLALAFAFVVALPSPLYLPLPLYLLLPSHLLSRSLGWPRFAERSAANLGNQKRSPIRALAFAFVFRPLARY